MEYLIKRTKRLLFAQQGGMFSSTLILSAMIVVSRIFGFWRYRILTGYFTKEELDVFFASFRIPDLIFEILITGALTTTLIPIFIKYRKNRQELEDNISSIFNLIILCLVFFVGALVLLMPEIVRLITPGFSPAQNEQVIFYSRILLIGQLPLLMIGNFITGIAQANKIFIISAIAPVLYNLAVIVFTILFAEQLYLLAPIVGVVVGALLFFCVQVPLFFVVDFNFLPVIKISAATKEFFRIVIPRIFTVVVSQIDATIDLSLTTILGSGSYTIFYLAQHLQLLPVSVIGVAFGQASLPYLSEIHREKKPEGLKLIISESLLNLFFFTIPIAFFLIFARTPTVRLFFGAQKFDWDATVETAITLSFFSLSIPLHSSYYFLTRCYYALLDSRTPFIISFISVLINIAISLTSILILKLPVWSLALSFSISIIVNVCLMFIVLDRRLKGFSWRLLAVSTGKIAAAAMIAAFFSHYLIKILDQLIFDTARTINVFLILLISGAFYLGLYLLISWFLNVKQIYLIGRLIIKAKQYQKKIIEVTVGTQ
ncbi:murein biosynthesis integral membrane protein MurJ [Patescibacteria group bacterium]|nr:murein biosynthesis integral membrane protein MurJ [Patescibacteria group bacterium]MCL5091759.1 murein biosynthesis integral membrane protein MurJ [Patescibacteria group bacterium]